MKKFLFFFCLLFLSSLAKAASLENAIIQTKIKEALSVRYPAGDVDLRLCTYGECVFTTLKALERGKTILEDPSDGAEISLILTTIFSSAGALLRPDTHINVAVKRWESDNPGPDGERKVIEADIVLGAGTCT